MSLSKLGGSVPLYSSQQNPFMLPPVLDILFPYLTFRELKISRLVCSTWNAIALPLIGQKDLKSHTFFQLTYKEFLDLQQEFVENKDAGISNVKFKFLQGFSLTWAQISKMAKLIAPFPNELSIYWGSDAIDPSASLLMLISPSVPPMPIHLLEIKYYETPYQTVGFLDGFGIQLNGLHLDIPQNGNTLCDLLGSQASTLEFEVGVLCSFLNTIRVKEAHRIQLSYLKFPNITSFKINPSQNHAMFTE